MSSAYDYVKIARKLDRPSSMQYINYMFDDFIELHGDRKFGDDTAIIGGIAKLNALPVTVIGIQKGQTTEENIARNFGQPHPEGYRKALRLMQQAEKFHRPIITLINTAGAYCGVSAEERGQGEAIAKNLFEMSNLRTPIISIIIGEGGSGGALALAVADLVWILEYSTYSILSPEGFASILWKDAKRAADAAEIMQLTSKDLLKLQIVDKIIDEKDGFNHTADRLKTELITNLKRLRGKDLNLLIEERYSRFRKF